MNNNQYSMQNCLFEMVKMWLKKEVNLEISDSYLFQACCNIGFEYESEKVHPGILFPKVDILQRMEADMLSKYFGIQIDENNGVETEQIWIEVEKELLADEMIVVRGVVSLLPNLENNKTVTYFAVQNYNPIKQLVDISSVYFNGTISVILLKKIMYETVEFGEPPNYWLKFRINNIPKLDNEKLYNLLLKNLDDPDLIRNSVNNMKTFLDDFASIRNLNPSLLKLIIVYFKEIMFHPLAPPSTRKQLYLTISELYQSGYLSKICLDKCKELATEWEKVKLNFAKEALKPSDNFVKWISKKLEDISKLEHDSLNEIILSTKGS